MAAYGNPRSATSRPFVVTAYLPAEDGLLHPSLPARGPCHERDDMPCRLSVDHLRERKTGPCFPLTVLRCRTHALAFTLYPPGHVPHGRQAVAPVAPDGHEETLPPDDVVGETTPLIRWQRTLLAAALDAAAGRAWPRASRPDHELGGWGSQGRLLSRGERLLGVSPEQDEAQRLRVADALSLDTLLLRDQARLARGAGYRVRGQAVVTVLAEVERQGCVLAPLLRAGHEAALWGPALAWEAATRVLRPVSFRPRGTRPP